MGVSELPDSIINIRNEEVESVKGNLPENIGELLTEYYKNVLDESKEIWFGYTGRGEVCVRVFNKKLWTKKIHEDFCEKFNLVLNNVDVIDRFSPGEHLEEVTWLYFPTPVNNKYIPLVSISYDDVKNKLEKMRCLL